MGSRSSGLAVGPESNGRSTFRAIYPRLLDDANVIGRIVRNQDGGTFIESGKIDFGRAMSEHFVAEPARNRILA